VLHRRIYGADATARCVIHTHSTHLVALSLRAPPGPPCGDPPPEGVKETWERPGVSLRGAWRASDIVPPITPYFVMKVGHVPLIPYHRPGDPQAGERVAQAIANGIANGAPIRAVMLDRLGPNVWHESPAAAMATLEELEETARLWLMTQAAPLSDPQIDELRQTFGVRW
jgi:3-dehydro-4-phosphotetronate decarboxylase